MTYCENCECDSCEQQRQHEQEQAIIKANCERWNWNCSPREIADELEEMDGYTAKQHLRGIALFFDKNAMFAVIDASHDLDIPEGMI